KRRDNVPGEMTRSRSRPFCASSSAIRNTSRLRSSISGPYAAYTSAGPDSVTRAPGMRARRRRVSSKGATSRAALAGPTPETGARGEASPRGPGEPQGGNQPRGLGRPDTRDRGDLADLAPRDLGQRAVRGEHPARALARALGA